MAVMSMLAVLLVWVGICAWLLRWSTAHLAGSDCPPVPKGGAQRAAGPPRRLLPQGHRPPPGLGPLSPSERFLVQEAERGLRDLQVYLLEQRAV